MEREFEEVVAGEEQNEIEAIKRCCVRAEEEKDRHQMMPATAIAVK